MSESKSKSSDSEIVKFKSIGLESKSQKTGLESKSWFRVLHLCPTVQQKYDFMITTLVKIAQVQCALWPTVSINVSTKYETKTVYSRPRSRPKQCNPLDQDSENTVSRLSRDETVSRDLTSLVSGRLQVYINSVVFKKTIWLHGLSGGLYVGDN